MTRGVVSDGHPAHAGILARPAPRILETWLIAGTPRWKPYPCACRLGDPCKTDGDFPCRCWGRLDPDIKIAHCCAARAARTADRLSRKDVP